MPGASHVPSPLGCQIAAEEPYPDLVGWEGAKRDGSLLLSALGGAAGELTSWAQYTQHSLLLRCWGIASGSEILSQAAQVEQIHLKLIGELIIRCGGRPSYWDPHRQTIWNGKMVPYPRSQSQVWQLAVQGERRSITLYQQLKRQVGNPVLRGAIDRILCDEALHLALFTELWEQSASPAR